MRADLRSEVSQADIDLVRKGLWKVVNEDGGTGSAARIDGVQVAGKTGTAQATIEGRKDNVAWFACFAPYDNPKYVVVVMVQGSEGHGGSVAAPIAARILQRTLAMDQGKFEPQVAWLTPAHKDNPFQLIKAVSFKDSLPGSDEEGSDDAQVQTASMAKAGDAPDVEPEADAAGKVANVKGARALRAQPVATPPPRQRNFFERMFNIRPRQPASTPVPAKKGKPAF
jgi:penicillin-binding protein 2